MLSTGRVVALDRTSELLKAASSNVLRFKLDADLPALAAQARVTGAHRQLPPMTRWRSSATCAVREAGLTAKTSRSARPTSKTCSSR